MKFELDKAKYLLAGIYSIIWCSWVWNFEDNSLSFYMLLCYGILMCQQGVFNVYQHFVCLPEIRKVGENPGKGYIITWLNNKPLRSRTVIVHIKIITYLKSFIHLSNRNNNVRCIQNWSFHIHLYMEMRFCANSNPIPPPSHLPSGHTY